VSDAVDNAKKAGMNWSEDKLMLRPSAELIELVRQSQELAAKEKGEGKPE
jgi:hypothetical protein